MRKSDWSIFAVVAILLLASLAAAIFTGHWGNYHERWRELRSESARAAAIVDTRELDTAQQLAQLAVTHTERDHADQALHLADHSVDVAFDQALRDATDNPPPLTPQTRELSERIKAADAVLDRDQTSVAAIQQKLQKARPAEKDDVQAELDFAQEQLSLHQEELEDARQDLIRAGGDKKAIIQQQLDQHNASEAHSSKPGSSSTSTSTAIENPDSRSLIASLRAFFSLRSKEHLLADAQSNALAREEALAKEHKELESQISAEKAQRRIIGTSGAANAESNSPGNSVSAPVAGQSASANWAAASPNTSLVLLRHLKSEQQDLSALNKRSQDERQLAEVYANWAAFVRLRQQAFLHDLFLAIFWILLIAACVLTANHSVQRFFADLSPERRELHTMRTVALVVIQALGVAFILLVIFGVPSNLATFVALATAGITVAMKDFIVGFVGWFVLMGKDGIRPGDWVEINGVGGEVIEVGLFRTILLEMGNWTDAAHPTGRKAAFVNSFAIEGHYFNFSSSGQWLWDEIQVQVPPNLDPYPVAEAIQKMAADETAANARQAEEEWTRVVPVYAKRKFSAEPSMSVKPVNGGVGVTVRYITRVRERQEVRARLYREIVDLLHQPEKNEPTVAPLRP